MVDGVRALGRWRSDSAREVYGNRYARALDELPTPRRTCDVDTTFGTVRAYEFRLDTAEVDAVPVVLLPGRSSGTPMWSENLPDLAARRTVYAVDAIGDAGLSVQTRPITNAAHQAAWIEEALDGLGLTRVHLVGHSFGGWTAANYATYFPKRLVTLSVLEPVFVFAGLRWQMYVTSIPASMPFLPACWRSRMLKTIGGTARIDPNDPIAAMIDAGLTGYSAKLPVPQQLSVDQLANLQVPVYAALGGASSMTDTEAAAMVARERLARSTVRVWPEGSHSLPMEVAAELDAELLRFMADHDD